MIVIKLIENNGVLQPERELTNDEKDTVTSILFNGIDAIYYQGDEPPKEEVENPTDVTE